MERINSIPFKNTKEGRAPSERGELLRFFALKSEWSIPRIAKKVSHLSVQDLYYMKSAFEDRERRNGKITAIKWFFWSLKPQDGLSTGDHLQPKS